MFTFLFFFLLCVQLGSGIVVKTAEGSVEGISTDSYNVFKGIPFAEPPVKELRWASPVATPSWGGETLNATSFKPGCPQHCSLPNGLCPAEQDEDCLYLNVWTPKNAKAESVMVFFYGGAFFQGGASVQLYWADYIANKTNSIVVLGNYRLGALGFAVTDTFDGNFGIEDQVLLLHWVQRNIAAFGGNPNHVTVFGESAGAMSIGIHLTQPASKGLFSAAIMESNPYGFEYKTRDEAKKWGNSLARDLNCETSDTSCMRAVPWQQVVQEQGKAFAVDLRHLLANLLPWTPNVAGPGSQIVPVHPMKAVREGNWNKMPVLLGTNNNEGVEFVFDAAKQIDEVEMEGAFFAYFGPGNFFKMRHLYPPAQGNQFWVVSRVITDFLFQCASRHVAEGMIQSESNEVFLYHYKHSLSFDPWKHYTICANQTLTCHGSELPLVFHSAANEGYQFTPDEAQLSEQMVHYWANFARTRNPNAGLPVMTEWPVFNAKNYSQLQLHTPSNVATINFNSAACSFWDAYYQKHQDVNP